MPRTSLRLWWIGAVVFGLLIVVWVAGGFSRVSSNIFGVFSATFFVVCVVEILRRGKAGDGNKK